MAQKKPKPLDKDRLWEYALRALGARAHSVSELSTKLRRRAGRAEDVGDVLARLKQAGYLDDRRFAQFYAASRLENAGLGRARVLRDLKARRVAPAVAEQAVGSAYRDVDELRLIEAFLERKYRSVRLGSHLSDPRRMAAAYRRLRLAGFSSGNVIRVLKRFSAMAEELTALEDAEPET
ncbi:MAG: RecX family transcriptional regulator [Bryobacterales bacterium]|nr:RecX family transcriptional regulator [Bryobacterales bacterium]